MNFKTEHEHNLNLKSDKKELEIYGIYKIQD